MRHLILLSLLGCAPVEPGLAPGGADGAEGTDGSDGSDGSDGGAAGYQEGDLVDAMDLDRLMGHLDALQAVADSHRGNRVAGSEGYDQSVAYIVEQLEAGGFAVTLQEFPWTLWDVVGPPTLETSTDDVWRDGADFATLGYSPPGDASGLLVAVDPTLPPGPENSSTSGCEASDFDGFPAGAVALIQRGSCTFSAKVDHAEAAGAVAVIVYNEGQSDRRGVVEGVLDTASLPGIPVVGASFAAGEALVEAADAGGVTARVVVDTLLEERSVANILADLPGESDQLVVVGAHLDSVQAGPGINDNGTGTALVLELALQARAAGFTPASTLRFAWWGAEEAGLVGSFEYVDRLEPDDLTRHLANLNFDMVGSPNGGRFVYDGDGSAGMGGYPAPAGSALIESFFTDFLDASGQIWAPTAFDGRSDYGPFIYYGIPAGGLFSGAETAMSAGEASDWGGSAGVPYDACYHRDCDAIDNIDEELFLDMSRAAAHATEATASLTDLSGAMPAPPAADATPLPEHPHLDRADLGGCAARPSR